jgi:phosphoglycolate phosphatase-like HAD superfamily hydrolase
MNYGPLIEIMDSFKPRTDISHAIFDFDGTLSWLRHGWPQMMADMFLEQYPLQPGETREQAYAFLMDELLSLNGNLTIFQMIRFGEHLRERGAPVPDPEALRVEYQRRLDHHIALNTEAIRAGCAKTDAYVVHGARLMLDKLQQRGIDLIILSGTPVEFVRREAELLGLAGYFSPHIYGGTGDLMKYSKKEVMERIIREEQIQGEHIISFGDGPVEIRFTKELGGLAVAVCSDEAVNGSGKVDPFKRKQLLAAGADAVIADYREPDQLIKFLWGK